MCTRARNWFWGNGFLAAQACKENNKGKVITIDNGVQWDQLTKYEHYMQHSTIRFSLGKHLEFINKDINCVFNMKIKPDIIFNDVSCGHIQSKTFRMAKRYKKESVLIIDRGLIMSKQLKDYQFSVIKNILILYKIILL